MVELLTSRCDSLAESVVTMLCPAFLALALKKDKLRLDDPKWPLILATASLTAGVSPSIACLISKSFPTACKKWALVSRRVAAPLSCTSLIVLAFAISTTSRTITAEIWAEFAISILFGSLVVIRTLVTWWFASLEEEENLPVVASSEEEKVRTGSEEEKLRGKIDKSHELLSGIIGIVFLGLEGMAGLVYAYKGLESSLRVPMFNGLIFCGVGFVLMSVHMFPVPGNEKMTLVVHITDGLVFVGACIILMTVTTKLAGNKGWLFLLPPVSVFISPVGEWLQDIITPPAQGNDVASQTLSQVKGNDDARQTLQSQVKGNDVASQTLSPALQEEGNDDAAQGEECKAAPLGVTKLMFTGFLGVSVMRATGSDLPVLLTDWFIIAAAAAIACGLVWRLLTHLETWNKTAANAAPFCTHLCVLAAAILLAVLACRVDTQDIVI